MKRFGWLFMVSAVLLLLVGSALAASPNDVPRMTKEQLRPLLGNPDLVVVDVRTAPEYNDSDQKIKGAIRVESGDIKAITGTYPKDRTIVLYCS